MTQEIETAGEEEEAKDYEGGEAVHRHHHIALKWTAAREYNENVQDNKNTKIETIAGVPVQDVFLALGSSEKGLSHQEATNRVGVFGKNSIVVKQKARNLMLFLNQLKSPILWVLLMVILVSLFLGEKIDALLVGIMVLVSVGLDFVQEYRADSAAERLSEKLAHSAVVVRGGESVEATFADIVPGDVVLLNAGDLIPADGRIFAQKDLYVNQSALTGESFPLEKRVDDESDGTLMTKKNLVFAGTTVITGSASMVVVNTGFKTELGKVARGLGKDTGNEFTRGIQGFSVLILKIVIIFVVVIFLINAGVKHDFWQALTFAVAVAVGLAPEFLPVIMSVNMGQGSMKMAKKGVIVKKLSAIPTFGSMNILCTDKTGTLTEDRIVLIRSTDVHGLESERVFEMSYLNSYFQTGITNPMDQAIRDHKKIDVACYKKLDEIPFDFERRRLSVIINNGEKTLMVVKGAPEDVIGISRWYESGGKKIKLGKTKQKIISQYNLLSSEGFRVLAIGYRAINKEQKVFSKEDEKDLVFLGLVSFLDPAKKNVKEAIDRLEDLGVEIKILTGDNELVAEKIAREVGINIRGVMIGNEVDKLSDQVLLDKINNSTVFARFLPEQKERVIKLLRTNKNVVGYLGDGVNDTSALRGADVGISVVNAVDIAKESADIVLTNKSLFELAEGVVEGRKTFANTSKYILMGVSSNFGNMFSVLGAVLFLPFLPMLPLQILLNNFLYDFGQITIPSDRVDEEYLKKSRHWDLKFIRDFMLVFGPISSVFDFLSFAVLYLLFAKNPSAFQTGWFMESLATQVLVIHVIRTRLTAVVGSKASLWLWLSSIGVVVLGWFIAMGPFGHYFGFVRLEWSVVLMLIGIVGMYLVCAELGKKWFYRRFGY